MSDIPLCAHHRAALERCAALSHVDEEVTTEAARTIAKQCPTCIQGDQ